MPEKVILDPYGRRLEVIFLPKDLETLRSFAWVLWAKNEPMPGEELEAVRDEVIAIIAGHWRHGDVTRFSN